jgi:predicted ATPase/class 3 adenylate cyclase
MGTLPSGTVTLLFSDIEGSTLLLRRLGPGYAGTLAAHRRILRAAWTAHGGAEQGTAGDSFFVVFGTAAEAVSAAVEAQRELAEFPWPDDEVVRVRIGIHTGTPSTDDDDYVGMDVHRGARIAAVAHGGQIVISDPTAHLLASGAPAGVTLRDLGVHQLKDLPEPERLYQVEADGLPARFPPLRSLGAATRLPMPGTALVGRGAELARLTDLVTAGATRLVTLTGTGGAGKTRLALEVARGAINAFPDGVHFIPLADVQTAEQMWDALATTLDVPPGSTHVLARLAGLRALLVVDNLEQLTGADRVVEQILQDTARAVLVATSRRPLHVAGEHEYPVSPLGMPSDDGLTAAQGSPAVQLFVQRARLVRPDFALTAGNVADVVALCRRLDGLPLAIEITAARVKVLSPHALVARLDTALDLATAVRDVADRQRTIRAAISWSYDLLTPELQAVFARLGVFDGGADLPAVSAVLDDGSDPGIRDRTSADPLDLVAPLVDASLVTVTENHDGEPRLEMLETLRAFALDRLAAQGALETTRAAHARHFLGVVESTIHELDGDRFWQAREELDAEQDNIRAALRWSLESEPEADHDSDRSDLALRLSARLCEYWDVGTKYVEARQWLERVVAQAGPARSAELGVCLSYLARCLNVLGEPEAARHHALGAVKLLRELGDSGRLALALLPLALATLEQGGPEAARPLFEEALEIARTVGETRHDVVDSVALFEGFEQHPQRALELHDEAIMLARAAGDHAAVRLYQLNRASGLRQLGRLGEAHDELVRLIPGVLGDVIPMELVAIAESYGEVLAELGQYPDAIQLLGAADVMRERHGYPRHPWQSAEIEQRYASSRTSLSRDEWAVSYQAGRHTTVRALLESALPQQSLRFPGGAP